VRASALCAGRLARCVIAFALCAGAFTLFVGALAQRAIKFKMCVKAPFQAMEAKK
jgi:hypothetical protein